MTLYDSADSLCVPLCMTPFDSVRHSMPLHDFVKLRLGAFIPRSVGMSVGLSVCLSVGRSIGRLVGPPKIKKNYNTLQNITKH